MLSQGYNPLSGTICITKRQTTHSFFAGTLSFSPTSQSTTSTRDWEDLLKPNVLNHLTRRSCSSPRSHSPGTETKPRAPPHDPQSSPTTNTLPASLPSEEGRRLMGVPTPSSTPWILLKVSTRIEKRASSRFSFLLTFPPPLPPSLLAAPCWSLLLCPFHLGSFPSGAHPPGTWRG